MLSGKINQGGVLEIQRAGEFNIQECRFNGIAIVNENPISCSCGDDCPHFGEPKKNGLHGINLQICQGRILQFDAFKDERGNE